MCECGGGTPRERGMQTVVFVLGMLFLGKVQYLYNGKIFFHIFFHRKYICSSSKKERVLMRT